MTSGTWGFFAIAAVAVLVIMLKMGKARKRRIFEKASRQEAVFDAITAVLARYGTSDYSLEVSADGSNVFIRLPPDPATKKPGQKEFETELAAHNLESSVRVS